MLVLPLLRSAAPAPLVSRGLVTGPRCVATVATAAASPIFEAGATVLGLAVAALLLLGVVPLGCWLAYEVYVLNLRKQRSGAGSAKSRGVEPGSSAYVRPRQVWRLDELPAYDGSGSEDGPILRAQDPQNPNPNADPNPNPNPTPNPNPNPNQAGGRRAGFQRGARAPPLRPGRRVQRHGRRRRLSLPCTQLGRPGDAGGG
jgi:hypothetical protein